MSKRSGTDDATTLALRAFTHDAARGLAVATSLDALLFTGEIGWNHAEICTDIPTRLKLLGIRDDLSANRVGSGPVSPLGDDIPVLALKHVNHQLGRDTPDAVSRRALSRALEHRPVPRRNGPMLKEDGP